VGTQPKKGLNWLGINLGLCHFVSRIKVLTVQIKLGL
jgi:hypothetical protein